MLSLFSKIWMIAKNLPPPWIAASSKFTLKTLNFFPFTKISQDNYDRAKKIGHRIIEKLKPIQLKIEDISDGCNFFLRHAFFSFF